MSAPIQGARYKVLIDPAAAPATGVQYVGFAQPNTATSEDAWAIMRLTFSASDLAAVEWAAGTNRFANVWDDRAAASYS